MKPTYEELEREIAELRQALTGRTVSCHACNQSAMERDMLRENIHEALEEIKELTKERDEARATVAEMRNDISIWDVQFGDQVHYAYRIPDSQDGKSTLMPPHEFREATQPDVERLMNNPIIKDIKFKAVDDQGDAKP